MSLYINNRERVRIHYDYKYYDYNINKHFQWEMFAGRSCSTVHSDIEEWRSSVVSMSSNSSDSDYTPQHDEQV